MAKKQSIIFLDVDGVLNSIKTGWFCWDMYVVNWVIWFAKTSNSKIVISSTWRMNHNLDFFADILTYELIYVDEWSTPVISETGSCRGDEIKMWLDKHSEEVGRYIIFDDDSDMLEEQLPNFIQTDCHNGLLFKNMDDAQRLFKVKGFKSSKENKHQHPIMFGEDWYHNNYRKHNSRREF